MSPTLATPRAGQGCQGASAVRAMSLGTAITVATLAVPATKLREWASPVVAHRSPLWALADIDVDVLGGALLLLFGLVRLSTSLARSTRLHKGIRTLYRCVRTMPAKAAPANAT